MTPRERVLAAINWRKPDRIPRLNRICQNPLHRLGEAGLELMRRHPCDFAPAPTTIPVPEPQFVQADGSWHRTWTDEWGCAHEETEYGISGMINHPPLADWAAYETYRLPPPPPCDPDHPEVRRVRAEIAEKKRRYYVDVCFFRTFEWLHFLRGMEEVMLDLALGDERLAALADRITELLPDMAEIGVKVVNPQFSCHDLPDLARRLRECRLAVMTDVDAAPDSVRHAAGIARLRAGDHRDISGRGGRADRARGIQGHGADREHPGRVRGVGAGQHVTGQVRRE